MTAKAIKHLKTSLLAQRAEILNYSSTRIDREVSESGRGDEADIATHELAATVVLSLRERQNHMLQKIDIALARIESGNFGICISCEEPLDEQRLRARPMADLCLSCQEEQELSQTLN